MNTQTELQQQDERQNNEARASLAGADGSVIFFRLAALDEDARAHAYVETNCWKWPKVLSDLEPNGWATLSMKEKREHPLARELWEALHQLTTQFSRSRQWHREEIGHTDEEHLEWWKRTYSPNKADMTTCKPEE